MPYDINKIIQLTSVISVVTELFPAMGMSYFLPRGGDNVEFYNKMLPWRVLAVLLVWSPILYKLYGINSIMTLIGGMFIMRAFYSRLYGEWIKNNVAANNYYAIGFFIIVMIMSLRCFELKCVLWNVLSVVVLLTGGSLIGVGRRGLMWIDLVGRVVFSTGFKLFIERLVMQ